MGLIGTTSPGGAEKFSPEYAEFFNKKQHVIILPDNDEPGRRHAQQVASVLNGRVASIKILELSGLPPGGDVTDWVADRDPLEAGEELCRLGDGAPEYQEKPSSEFGLWHGQIYGLEEAFKPSPPIQYVVEGIIGLPSLTILYGAPGGLKSLLLADMAICVAAGLPWLRPLPGHSGNAFSTMACPVMWLDFDNGKARTGERFAALARSRNVSPQAPLHYVSMPSPWLDAGDTQQMDGLAQCIERLGIRLLIVDNLRLVTGKAEENYPEMAPVMANWRRHAEHLGIAIVIIHHQRKEHKRGSGGGRRGDSLRGHSSIEASLDLALLIDRQGQDGTVNIWPTKVRGADVHPFSGLFTYTHKPGTTELAEASFFGMEIEDFSSNQAIERIIIEVIDDIRKDQGPPNKGALVKRAQESIDARAEQDGTVGINRIREILERMVAEHKLICTTGNQGAKLYDLPPAQ